MGRLDAMTNGLFEPSLFCFYVERRARMSQGERWAFQLSPIAAICQISHLIAYASGVVGSRSSLSGPLATSVWKQILLNSICTEGGIAASHRTSHYRRYKCRLAATSAGTSLKRPNENISHAHIFCLFNPRKNITILGQHWIRIYIPPYQRIMRKGEEVAVHIYTSLGYSYAP